MDISSEAIRLPFGAWQNFYVIVGSSGGALIGLQFVVVALGGNMRRKIDADANLAFGTPTVVHFGMALTISAIMCVPWRSLLGPTFALAACGIGGLACLAVAFRRVCRQSHYKPVSEDWCWYGIVPAIIYAVLVLGSLLVPAATVLATFVIGGCALGLLFVGIHNAWDTVTYIVSSDGDRGAD
jgi:hypothetical protein